MKTFRNIRLSPPAICLIFIMLLFAGCEKVPNSEITEHDSYTLELTGTVEIAIAYDSAGKTVEYWANAENDIDWDARDKQPQNLCTAAYAAVELKKSSTDDKTRPESQTHRYLKPGKTGYIYRTARCCIKSNRLAPKTDRSRIIHYKQLYL